MRDALRAIESHPNEVPFGIVLVSDGRSQLLDFSRFPRSALRAQLRDAVLETCMDRGGNVRSPLSVVAYLNATSMIFKALGTEPADLDIRNLEPHQVHAAIFVNVEAPVSIQIVLARKLLAIAARDAGHHTLLAYLGNLRLYGYGRPSNPYTAEELDHVLAWCKAKFNALVLRRGTALRLIDVESDWPDDQIYDQATAFLRRTEPTLNEPVGNEAWWVAWTYVHQFATPPVGLTDQDQGRAAAIDALFANSSECAATQLLIINEFGVEGQVLASLDVSDVSRVSGNSSVVEIRGVKTRANRAVSRRGNTVSAWSGGRVLERWIDITAPARRWTGAEDVWQWRSQQRLTNSIKTLRAPIQHPVPGRTLILEGTDPIEGPNGVALKLSIRRMRKTWALRTERAVGPGIAGTLDPEHSRLSEWSFYRAAALTREERLAVVSEAQEDLAAMVHASQTIVDTDLSRPEALDALVGRGVPRTAAERIVRGDADDSGTVTCREPRKAPRQRVGTMCQQTPFACILCPNAVHTRTHLPVILALSESIAMQRRTLPAEEFVSRWAGIDAGVDHVILAFSAPAIAEASKDLEEARSRLSAIAGAYE